MLANLGKKDTLFINLRAKNQALTILDSIIKYLLFINF